jgi:hypothetical protein
MPRSFKDRFDPLNKILFTIFIFPIFLLILSGGCAPLHRTASVEPLTISGAEGLLSAIIDQNKNIQTFYSIGTISIKGLMLGSDANILMAGVRKPFAMKIEITHSWGKPALHILIREGRLEVLSYQEKLNYSGTFSPEALSNFLPGLVVDREMIWSILSGRPPVLSHESIAVSGNDMVSLQSNEGIEVEAINFPFGASFPEKVSFPTESLKIFFSNLKEENRISYAGEIKLSGEKLEKDFVLKINEMVYNAPVPDQIFTLEVPLEYETVNLDDFSKFKDK